MKFHDPIQSIIPWRGFETPGIKKEKRSNFPFRIGFRQNLPVIFFIFLIPFRAAHLAQGLQLLLGREFLL